jgi:hypothetical protein
MTYPGLALNFDTEVDLFDSLLYILSHNDDLDGPELA